MAHGSDAPSSEEQLRILIDGVEDYAIILLDPAGYVTSWNSGARRIKGFRAEEIIGQHMSRFYPEADVAAGKPQRELDLALADGRFEEEGWRIRKDGSRFWASLILTPVRGQSGKHVGFAKVTRDMTARKQAEEQNAVLAAVFDYNPDAIVLIDRRGLIVNVNNRTSELFGYPREALRDQPIEVLLPERYRDRHVSLRDSFFDRPKARAMGTGQVLFARRADGREIQVDVLIAPVQRGAETLGIAIVRDVTERRAIEAQLRQAQKMEAIGNLTGGMAHDFNNLLGIVIGNLDLLSERPSTDPDEKELAREALEAALRGADLTQRLLAFARRQPLQPERVELNELVDRISKLLSRTIGENIEIKLDLGSDIWPVVVDPAQLEASLVNIVNNARDAMPKGGLLIIATSNRHLDADYASQHPGLAPGDYALIEVSDTGTGMPQDVAEQIFEPFFTTKKQGKGTGLGLSMVFGFMKQSCGHINVYSEVGVGTIFRLYLPRAVAGVAATEAQPIAAPEHGRETILAVEDNAGLRRVVGRQLKELGYRLLEAEDGPTALKILESERVDLLFTDIVMPGGMSGYDLARSALSRWPAMKAVLTSGFPEAKLNGNGGPPVNLRLLIKPYRKADLARILREVLDG